MSLKTEKSGLSMEWAAKAHVRKDIFAQPDITTTPAARDIDMTDLYPDEDFTVTAPTAQATASVQGPNISVTDTKGMKQDINSTRDQYMKCDTAFKGFITDVARAELGRERGDAVMGQTLPKPSPSYKQAVMAMIDPTGGSIGAIMAAKGELEKNADRIPNPEILAELDRVNSAAQQICSGQKELMSSDNKPILPPPGLDMEGVTAQELQQCLERNVAMDPVIQECDNAMRVVENIELNEQYALENDAQFVTAAKIEASIGDQDRLVELTGGDEAVAAAAESCSSYAVDMVREGLQMPPAINTMSAEFASISHVGYMLSEAVPKDVAMSQNLEAELSRLNRETDFSMGRMG